MGVPTHHHHNLTTYFPPFSVLFGKYHHCTYIYQNRPSFMLHFKHVFNLYFMDQNLFQTNNQFIGIPHTHEWVFFYQNDNLNFKHPNESLHVTPYLNITVFFATMIDIKLLESVSTNHFFPIFFSDFF